MFKNKISEKAKKSKLETVNEFLARGGKVNKFIKGDSGKRKTRKSNKIDAQKLLDNCKNEAEERSCIDFLKTQGIEVRE